MSHRSAHALRMEVQGRHGKYVVTRSSSDGSFQCTCPWYNHRKTDCHHISEVRPAVVGLMPQPDLAGVVEDIVRKNPYFISNEAELISRLRAAVSK